jgi:hypothetical protein
MAHDVFISYSSKDKNVADAVCATLEERKIRCWIAPRDVPPGLPYAAALVNAINESSVFVLVFSEGSNTSGQVLREVEEAVDEGIPIIPLRIEDVEPTDAMRYYIKSLHWLDAMTPPLKRHLNKLTDSVQAILSVGDGKEPQPLGDITIDESDKRPWPLPTWASGVLALLVVGIFGGISALLITKLGAGTDEPISTEVNSPSAVAPTKDVVVNVPEGSSTSEIDDEWRTLSFMIPDPQLWVEIGDEHYTATGNSSHDAFAWSTETFEGNLSVRLELESPEKQSEGCVILFGGVGGGQGFSYGSLIFCVESDFYQLEKHTRDHDGENFITYAPSNIEFNDQVISVEIEIAGDVASMYVNGTKVLSTVFDMEEITRKGRIGLHKAWIGNEITFSNIQIRIPDDVNRELSDPLSEEFDCELDTSSQPGFYTIESPYGSHPIEVDGEISSIEEWSDAACVDLRMHYSFVASNPNFQQVRWWVKNDEEVINFLVRIPDKLATHGVFIDYFWPEYAGAWEHSDGVYINVEGELFDHSNWDETRWYEDEDLDPPGTIDVNGAVREDDGFYWFEIKRPLNTGDSYDWDLNPGQTVGNNPHDSFLIGIVLDEGEFMRYIQLILDES